MARFAAHGSPGQETSGAARPTARHSTN